MNGWLRFDAWIGTAGAVLFGLGIVLGQSIFLLLGIAIGAAAALLAWRDRSRASRLSETYAEFARAHGWEHVSATSEYGSRFRAYPFSTGVRRRQESLIRGEFGGVRCATFAHVYEETSGHSGEQSVPIAHQVVMAELPVALPRIDIVPEAVGQQVLQLLGGTDVEVESYEFNRRWRVITADPRYARAVLDPRMIDRLIADDADGLMLRIEGGAVYTWQPGRQGADALARRLAVVTGVARRVPQHVLRQYRQWGYGVKDGFAESAPAWATESGALTSRQPTDLAAAAGWLPVAAAATAPHGAPRRDGASEPASTHGEPPASDGTRTSAVPTGPAWATESGALTGRRYTGVGVDADGDGIEDWRQMNPGRDDGRR
ncbi:hypothetical protein [Demequina activiva]|uniref:DUF3137 domain-containing protein n=1 Tax=Demequina activiva TaxID=1582364 RepID=A0A919Q0R3_9MICO|nr:hypothetical protein [Demequina activiva]GIG54007.1 hypothetical protein Dac01nite_07590 [Demequina activiva]